MIIFPLGWKRFKTFKQSFLINVSIWLSGGEDGGAFVTLHLSLFQCLTLRNNNNKNGLLESSSPFSPIRLYLHQCSHLFMATPCHLALFQCQPHWFTVLGCTKGEESSLGMGKAGREQWGKSQAVPGLGPVHASKEMTLQWEVWGAGPWAIPVR